MKNLRDLACKDILDEITGLDEKPYRATQIFRWVYSVGVASIDEMTDISKESRENFKKVFRIKGIDAVDVRTSEDGTRKIASALDDNALIESVIIPDEGRLTLCVSSQAGCAMNCGFCRTGRAGFLRDLKVSELTGQVFTAKALLLQGQRITNIVLMGMGEPLLNYGNVLKFIGILTDPKGFGFSHNRVTVSTCGYVPGILSIARDADVNLAVSLNAATDEVRDKIMPINKKYPIKTLLKAMRQYAASKKKYVTIEYVLLKGVNDSEAEARTLARLLRGIECKINLIPFNPFPGAGFESPDERTVNAFRKILRDSGLIALKRAGKGGDILAACGQLAFPGRPGQASGA